MNRYYFSQDQVTKDKFPKCQKCGSDFVKPHECPGPKVPTYGQRTNLDRLAANATPLQQIWQNANEQMLEDEEDTLEEDNDFFDDINGGSRR